MQESGTPKFVIRRRELMTSKPLLNHRSIRMPGYDYTSPGVYFITICTHNRACIFGEIRGGEMHLSPIGKMAQQEWLRLPARLHFIALDVFIVMPNHIHGIIIILESGPETAALSGREAFGKPVTRSLATVMRAYKSAVTLRANISNTIWQANYWERIVRGEVEWNTYREYIQTNPTRWLESLQEV
jgi:putative transposase